MKRLDFYDVNPEYLDYLQSIDSKVPNHNYSTHSKRYCGVILQINDCDYLAPLSHFKRQQATNFVIKDNHNSKIASLRFCFMIPVLDSVINITDFGTADSAYTGLLRTELEYCRRHDQQIYHGARRVYTYGIDPHSKFYANCCDFYKLEQEFRNYHVN